MNYVTREELIRSERAAELRIDNKPPLKINAALDLTLFACNRVRAFLGHPMLISSGYRSPALNRVVGGASSSQHLLGEAIDFTCPGYGSPYEVASALALNLELLGIDQIILEPTWVHCSFTVNPRHQILHAKKGGGYGLGLP